MTHEALATAVKALQAECRDIRSDYCEPQEQVNRELTALRQYDRRLLATIRKSHAQLFERIRNVITNIDALTKAVNDTIAYLNSLVAAGSVPQSAVDMLATNLTTALTAAQGTVTPPAPPADTTAPA